jgi:hypothetical protein
VSGQIAGQGLNVKKANDQPDGTLSGFQLIEPFDFNLDEDGDPVRTFIVNPRARFEELRRSLARRKLIGTRDAFVWPATLPTN